MIDETLIIPEQLLFMSSIIVSSLKSYFIHSCCLRFLLLSHPSPPRQTMALISYLHCKQNGSSCS